MVLRAGICLFTFESDKVPVLVADPVRGPPNKFLFYFSYPDTLTVAKAKNPDKVLCQIIPDHSGYIKECDL